MKLSDETISLIARQLQIAILTGTDVVDNLRLIDLEELDGQLHPTKASIEIHDKQIKSMLDVIENGSLVSQGESSVN